jgi:hypothetical protein
MVELLVANSATLTQRSASNKPKKIDGTEINETPIVVKKVRETFQSKDLYPIPLKQTKDLVSLSKSIQFETVTLREAPCLQTQTQDDSVNGKVMLLKQRLLIVLNYYAWHLGFPI